MCTEKAERIWDLGTVVSKHVVEMVDSLKKPQLSSTPFSLKVAQFCSSLVELLKMGTSGEQQVALVCCYTFNRFFKVRL